MLQYDLELLDDEYTKLEGSVYSFDELQEIICKDKNIVEFVGRIKDDNCPEFEVCIATITDVGIFIGIAKDKKEYLSLNNRDTDVWLYHKDTWGGLEMMKLQLEFAMNMSGEASEYATAVAKQLDFESDIKKKGVVRVTPTKGVGCVVATQGDYYMISLEVVSKPRLLAIWFGIVAVLWTMWLAARVWIRWSRL